MRIRNASQSLCHSEQKNPLLSCDEGILFISFSGIHGAVPVHPPIHTAIPAMSAAAKGKTAIRMSCPLRLKPKE